MSDHDHKTAAAILACEASRQQLEVMNSTGARDIPGELLQLYQWYTERLGGSSSASASSSSAAASSAVPGTAARSW